MSDLAGQRLKKVELHRPRWGAAWARVSTELGAVPGGPATLTVGDLALKGTVIGDRSGEDAPSSWSGIWVNGAAWDTVLPARPAYQSDAGVRLKTVLKDLAADCGGPAIVQPTDAALGAFWARPRRNGDRSLRTGRDELAALVRGGYVPAPWWADDLDVTRFGGRTTGEIAAASRVTARDPVQGMRFLGVDSVAAFVPGGTFEGARIGRVVIREADGDGFTVETWTR